MVAVLLGSKENVRLPVDGGPVNPTLYPGEAAFVISGLPLAGDWTMGSWTTENGVHKLLVTIGPGGKVLAAGEYNAFVRVTTPDEQPVLAAGTLEVLSASDWPVPPAPSGVTQGPCAPWCTPADVHECDNTPLDPGIDLTEAIGMASFELWALTGRRWPGVCSQTIRPCAECGCDNPYSTRMWEGTARACADGGHDLGRGDIIAITSVRVDGAVVSPSLYRLDERRWLVPVRAADGTLLSWPCSQDLSLPAADADWSVSYTFGGEPPPGGSTAAAMLAKHIALACAGSDDCAFSPGTIAVSRDGVSVSMDNPTRLPMSEIAKLPVVMGWLEVLNPSKLARSGRAIMVDRTPARRRVG